MTDISLRIQESLQAIETEEGGTDPKIGSVPRSGLLLVRLP